MIASPQRVPLTHPDYRYPESRNPYWKKMGALAGRVFADGETEAHRGQWLKQFPKPQKGPLHVEIGCNAGHVTVEWAARDPKAAYIGIDYKIKAIHRAGEKVVKRGLENLIFFRSHASRLKYAFAPGEIDFLYLFFPDPWPKKAHWKNRFLTEECLRDVAPLLKSGGIFHIKTDHAGYFEWMEEAIAKVGDLWEPFERSADLHRGHPSPEKLEIPEVTLFEKLFVKDGLPIHSVKLRKRG